MKDYFTVSKNQYFQSIFHNEEMCLEATIVQSNQGTPQRKAWKSANAKLTGFVESQLKKKKMLKHKLRPRSLMVCFLLALFSDERLWPGRSPASYTVSDISRASFAEA